MPETELEAITLASADSWDVSTRMEITTSEGPVVFQVHDKGEEPMIDVLETPEGITTGPLMKFLGSVASQGALFNDGLRSGEIVRTYRLVVEAGQTPYLLSGKVESAKRTIGKPRKNTQW